MLRMTTFAALLLVAAEAAAWECITVSTKNRFRGAGVVFVGTLEEIDPQNYARVHVTEVFKGVLGRGEQVWVGGWYRANRIGDQILVFGQLIEDPPWVSVSTPCGAQGSISDPEVQKTLRELRRYSRWWRIRHSQ